MKQGVHSLRSRPSHLTKLTSKFKLAARVCANLWFCSRVRPDANTDRMDEPASRQVAHVAGALRLCSEKWYKREHNLDTVVTQLWGTVLPHSPKCTLPHKSKVDHHHLSSRLSSDILPSSPPQLSPRSLRSPPSDILPAPPSYADIPSCSSRSLVKTST